jgi:hypothetical protein
VLLLLSATWAAGQEPVAPKTEAPQKTSYETLLERVKNQDKTVDFKELRLAYADTSQYSPYGVDREGRKAMFGALSAKEYDKALTSAETILAKNYLDIMGHFGCFVAHRELDHADKAAYHRFVFDGLINSIKNSGDGLAMETAFVVISTDEEYAFFNWLGLRPGSQALIKEKDHNYDKMTVLDPKTNQTVVYYFNIDKPFAWLSKSLKP